MNPFQQYFIDTLKYRYADFEGRARRSEYWYFNLFYVISYILLSIVGSLGLGILPTRISTILSMGILGIFILGMIIPNLTVAVRRLHDTDKSGWLLLLGIVPFIGGIILLVFFCIEGDRGPNQYGPDPKSTEFNNPSEHLIERF